MMIEGVEVGDENVQYRQVAAGFVYSDPGVVEYLFWCQYL